MPTLRVKRVPAGGAQVALLLAAAAAPTTFPAHKPSSLTESTLGRKGSSISTGLQTVATTAERKTQRENLGRKLAMDLIPSFSTESWVLLATSLVLLYL